MDLQLIMKNLEKQDADTDPEYFSFLTKKTYNKQIACSVTYTNKKVHEIIKKNLKKSAMYSGKHKRCWSKILSIY